MEEESTSRRVQFLVLIAVSIASMTSGVSIYWSTPVLPKFHDHETSINITEKELSWIMAMSSPGILFGSLATSFITDRYGRRPAVLGSALPIIIGTVFLVAATKPWMLFITRFAWGCGVGIFVTASPIYLVEVADKNIRGMLSVGNRFMFHFGSFMVMAVGPFVSYQVLNYMLLVLPIGYFAICWWIPETPYLLLRKGRVDQARRVLMKLRGYKDEKILEDQLFLMQSDVKKEMRRSGSVKELFMRRQYRKAILITAGIKLTQVMAGSVAIMQYLGRIVQDSEADLDVSTALIIFVSCGLVVGMASALVVDKIGRRPLLISSYSGACIFLSIVGAYFYYKDVIGFDDEPTYYRYIPLTGIVCSNILSTLGYDSLVFVIPAELFPINVKSIAIISMNVLTGISTFILVKGYQEIKDLTGLYGVFWFFAASALVGAVFSFYIVPETKGKSLREIQMELQGVYYDDDTCLDKISEKDINCELTELQDLCENSTKVNSRL